MSPSAVETTDHPDRSRFEVTVDGEPAGLAAYARDPRRPGVLVMTHTEVDDAHEGHGIGSALVRSALDTVRERDERVDPQCPFVAEWISRHPGYADLVDDPTSPTQ